MIQVAIFASGNGTNAENILRYFQSHQEVVFPLLLCNRADAPVLQRSAQAGVPTRLLTRQDMEGNTLLALLRQANIDFIVLAGFLWKIPNEVLAAYPMRIVNIHPSLLPKYGGKGMYGDKVHAAVVAAGEEESGITVHLVNEVYDCGDILFQASCPVAPGDSPAQVAAKVHALEYQYYPKVIESLLAIL